MPTEIEDNESDAVTEVTRQAIWYDLWDAERYVRYYGSLAGRYRLRHGIIRGSLLASVLIEATIILPLANTIITVIGGALIVLLVVWEAISNYARDAALLGSINADCSTLNDKWEDLWLDVESYAVSEGEARSRRRLLVSEFNSIERRIEMSTDEDLSASSAKEAKKALEEKYGEIRTIQR